MPVLNFAPVREPTIGRSSQLANCEAWAVGYLVSEVSAHLPTPPVTPLDRGGRAPETRAMNIARRLNDATAIYIREGFNLFVAPLGAPQEFAPANAAAQMVAPELGAAARGDASIRMVPRVGVPAAVRRAAIALIRDGSALRSPIPERTVARTTPGLIIFNLDNEAINRGVFERMEGSAGSTNLPIPAHELFHLIEFAEAPTFYAWNQFPREVLPIALSNAAFRLRDASAWITEGMAAAAAFGVEHGLGGNFARALRSEQQGSGEPAGTLAEIPRRNWGKPLDDTETNPYDRGAFFWAASKGQIRYLASVLRSFERLFVAERQQQNALLPGVAFTVVRRRLLWMIRDAVVQAGVPQFPDVDGARNQQVGMRAAFLRAVMASGRYRGQAQHQGDDQFGGRMYRVADEWTIGGQAGDVLAPYSAATRAYFPSDGARGNGRKFVFSIPNDANLWPDGFVLMIQHSANAAGMDDESTVTVLARRGETFDVNLGTVSAEFPVYVNVASLSDDENRVPRQYSVGLLNVPA